MSDGLNEEVGKRRRDLTQDPRRGGDVFKEPASTSEWRLKNPDAPLSNGEIHRASYRAFIAQFGERTRPFVEAYALFEDPYCRNMWLGFEIIMAQFDIPPTGFCRWYLRREGEIAAGTYQGDGVRV